MKTLLQKIISLLWLAKKHQEIEVPQEPQQEPTYKKEALTSYDISGYTVNFLEITKTIGDFSVNWYVTEILKGDKTILVGEYNDKDVAEFYHYRALREVLDVEKVNKELASKAK